MVAYFPPPYPDELFYSICARFAALMRYPSPREMMQDLFGKTSIIATIEFPSHLGNFVNAVPWPEIYSVENIIQRYTLLPLYTPFMPTGRLNQIKADMCSNRGMGIHMRAGLMADGMLVLGKLRYCPKCFQEDQEKFHDSYWHRAHQIAGVNICPIHHIFLEESQAQRTGQRTRYLFYSAKDSIEQTVHQRNDTTPNKLLTYISDDVFWLLASSDLAGNPSKIHQGYLTQLTKRRFANKNGRLNTQKLLVEFTNFYGNDVLDSIGCNINGVKDNWLLRLLHRSDRVYPPLRHILLIRFLGLTTQEFFQFVEEIELDNLRSSQSSSEPLPKELKARNLPTFDSVWDGKLKMCQHPIFSTT